MGLTWLAIGDSITNGIGATSYLTGYLMNTRTALMQNGNKHHLINSAVGGQTSGTLLGLHKSRGGKCDPDLVTIMIGTNDAGQGVSTSTFYNNMQSLITEITKNQVVGQCKIILLTAPWRSDYDVSPYNTQTKSLATANNLTLIDTYTAFNTISYLNQSNLPHPNDAGHQALSNMIIPVLEGLSIWNNVRGRG